MVFRGGVPYAGLVAAVGFYGGVVGGVGGVILVCWEVGGWGELGGGAGRGEGKRRWGFGFWLLAGLLSACVDGGGGACVGVRGFWSAVLVCATIGGGLFEVIDSDTCSSLCLIEDSRVC